MAGEKNKAPGDGATVEQPGDADVVEAQPLDNEENGPTKAELQETLRANDEPVTGTKDELEDRVEALSKVYKPDVFVAQIRPKGK